MQESRGTAPAASAHYLWQVAGKTPVVYLNLDFIDRLGLEVLEGFKSVPRRGLEIGGLLLGRTETRDGAAAVFVEDHEPVQSEHRRGPSYILSDADQSSLREKISRWNLEGRSIVGFYRSHTRPEFSLSDEDVSLMETDFPDPWSVFLLIKPSSNAPSVAGIFVREDGKFQATDTPPQFPFHRAELAPAEVRPPAARHFDSRRVMEHFSRELARARETVPAVPPGSRKRPEWVWMAASVIMLIAALVLFLQRRPAGPVKPPARTPLSMNVVQDGDRLRLAWNRDAPAVREGRRASLWISDGEQRRQVQLDPGQLTAGSIVYWPKSSDVHFRLEIETAQGVWTESVRSVGNPVRPEPAAAKPPPPPPARPSPARVQASKPGKQAPKTIAAQRKPSPFGLPRRPPSVAVEPAKPELEAPPPLEKSPAPAPVIARLPAPQPPPFSTVTVEQVHGSRFGRAVGKIPLIRRLRKDRDYVPPKPIHQSSPVLSTDLRRTVAGRVPVNIRVYINESGRVDYAELLPGAADINRRLASLALDAARRWRFSPARVGDQAVPSEVILRYRFGEIGQ